MKRKLIIDGNAVYEVDEECLKRKETKDKKAAKERTADNKERTE